MEGEKGKVCVTGGTGFIASWLIMKLLQHGYSVNATIRSHPRMYLSSVNPVLLHWFFMASSSSAFFYMLTTFTCLGFLGNRWWGIIILCLRLMNFKGDSSLTSSPFRNLQLWGLWYTLLLQNHLYIIGSYFCTLFA